MIFFLFLNQTTEFYPGLHLFKNIFKFLKKIFQRLFKTKTHNDSARLHKFQFLSETYTY
jgi:hypothetical protein